MTSTLIEGHFEGQVGSGIETPDKQEPPTIILASPAVMTLAACKRS
jgi:hypothetical protein